MSVETLAQLGGQCSLRAWGHVGEQGTVVGVYLGSESEHRRQIRGNMRATLSTFQTS